MQAAARRGLLLANAWRAGSPIEPNEQIFAWAFRSYYYPLIDEASAGIFLNGNNAVCVYKGSDLANNVLAKIHAVSLMDLRRDHRDLVMNKWTADEQGDTDTSQAPLNSSDFGKWVAVQDEVPHAERCPLRYPRRGHGPFPALDNFPQTPESYPDAALAKKPMSELVNKFFYVKHQRGHSQFGWFERGGGKGTSVLDPAFRFIENGNDRGIAPHGAAYTDQIWDEGVDGVAIIPIPTLRAQ